MGRPPDQVQRLAERRAEARALRDFATADALRNEIESAGWLVRDGPQGPELTPKPPYEVHQSLKALLPPATKERPVTVAILVEGYPDDLRRCVEAIIEHTAASIAALDLGNMDGAGDVLHELATRYPQRVEEWHVAQRPAWRGGDAGWGASRTKLLEMDGAAVHVTMETSIVMDGDAISPLLEALTEPTVAAGWRGVDPDPDNQGWHDAEGEEATALLGYLLAVRRSAAVTRGFPAKARYYRNADLEFSLSLQGTKRVVGSLPVRQERHRAYHDADPAYRERESRRNYQRVLEWLRHGSSL